MIRYLLFFILFQAPQDSNLQTDLELESQDPAGLQAVIETSLGEVVIEFYPETAPNHVNHFIRLAREDFYDGTTFHSMFPSGIVQAGDPYTREPDRVDEYGTGGFNMDLEPEISEIQFTSGTVVATLLPGEPSSAGSQFFICITDQPQFTGQFTAFARVVAGLEILNEISMTPVNDSQIALERMEIADVRIQPIPPPALPPFSQETISELNDYQAVMETSFGEITLELFPSVAPNHVRHFLRLASVGAYDMTAVHRVAPGFVIQAGDLNTRREPYPQAAGEFIVPIAAEISDIKHTAGIVSMARGEALDSALTSFFIVLDEQPALDNYYTVFGQVAAGMEVVELIADVPTENERPLERVDVYTIRVERKN
jgi:peptidyl-prolyl cis-trans isomerase B (cyclophilin B)